GWYATSLPLPLWEGVGGRGAARQQRARPDPSPLPLVCSLQPKPARGGGVVNPTASRSTPATTPPAAYRAQSGFSTTGPDSGNFGWRSAVHRPQLAPTVPSLWYFQPWSNASMRL